MGGVEVTLRNSAVGYMEVVDDAKLMRVMIVYISKRSSVQEPRRFVWQ